MFHVKYCKMYAYLVFINKSLSSRYIPVNNTEEKYVWYSL